MHRAAAMRQSAFVLITVICHFNEVNLYAITVEITKKMVYYRV